MVEKPLSCFLFGTLYAFLIVVKFKSHMTDIDFIRLSALVLMVKLIGKSDNPEEEAVEMAERLFNELSRKEV